MTNAIDIALSGLRAQGRRLSASAENIVNISTTGTIPTVENPQSNVFKALEVKLSSNSLNGTGAGVSAEITRKENFAPIYDPNSVYANEEGFIAAPDIQLESEITTMMTAKLAYKANINVIKTQNEMLGELLDSIS